MSSDDDDFSFLNFTKKRKNKFIIDDDTISKQKKKLADSSEEEEQRDSKEEQRDSKEEEHSKKKSQKPNPKEKFQIPESQWKQFVDKDPAFEDMQLLVHLLNKTTSMNEKKEIMGKHPHCVKLLLYAMNQFWQFYNSSIRVKKTMESSEIRRQGLNPAPKNLFSLLDLLRNREITGNVALGTICNFIDQNRKYENLICCILDKNLKIRCGISTVNSVFQNLIPDFPVALANKIADVPKGKFLNP
jgi:hypothetical protein